MFTSFGPQVQKLTHERDGKRVELDALLKETPENLWNADLDDFVARFDMLERELEEASLASARKVNRAKGLGGKKAAAAKPKPKKAAVRKASDDSDESEEDEIEDDDFDEDGDGDFDMARKPAAKPAAVKKPAAAVPVPKPVAKAAAISAKEPAKSKAPIVIKDEPMLDKPVAMKRESWVGRRASDGPDFSRSGSDM